MRTSALLFAVATVCSVAAACDTSVTAPTDFPVDAWRQVETPHAYGWSREGLAAARSYSETIGSAAVMIVHRGLLIDQWGRTDVKYNSHSIRKSLLSALYGIYSERGIIDLEMTIAELGIDEIVPLTDLEKEARIVDLLRSRSGVYLPAAYQSRAQRDNLPPRGSHEPGSFWYYNNWDFNALGTIFELRTGLTIGEAFRRDIAEPTNMEDFEPADVVYVEDPVSVHLAYPFRITARDLARFGLMYLADGRWQGQQVVPSAWVDLSSTSAERLGAFGGYEYLWWVEDGGHFPGVDLGGGAFSAQGAGGHYVVVVPRHDLVVVNRMDTYVAGPRIGVDEMGQLLARILAAKSG